MGKEGRAGPGRDSWKGELLLKPAGGGLETHGKWSLASSVNLQQLSSFSKEATGYVWLVRQGEGEGEGKAV